MICCVPYVLFLIITDVRTIYSFYIVRHICVVKQIYKELPATFCNTHHNVTIITFALTEYRICIQNFLRKICQKHVGREINHILNDRSIGSTVTHCCDDLCSEARRSHAASPRIGNQVMISFENLQRRYII